MSILLGDDFFEANDLRPPGWDGDADVERAVDWLISQMQPGEWKKRRLNALYNLFSAATGRSTDTSGKGRVFDSRDFAAWYLFLGKGYVEHPTVYDFVYGARVVPLFRALGRSVEVLSQTPGVRERVHRMLGSERASPDGALYELLVTGAYLQAGANVELLPERPGIGKTHDMDVYHAGVQWAVECKRMLTSEYGECERTAMRERWFPATGPLQSAGISAIARVEFLSEIRLVPLDYFARKINAWQNLRPRGKLEWSDEYSSGEMEALDLSRIRREMAQGLVAAHSARFLEVLTGRYKRGVSVMPVIKQSFADNNPLYVRDIHQAIVLEWESKSSAAISSKARDIMTRLSQATEQLPNRPSLVHIGLESVEGNDVETERARRALESIRRFDPRGKELEYVYLNWFVPDSTPEISIDFQETARWVSVLSKHTRPLPEGYVVLAPSDPTTSGGHWQQ